MRENYFNKMRDYIDSLVAERRITKVQSNKLHDMFIEACIDALVVGRKQEAEY
jgi:hypothetical protein